MGDFLSNCNTCSKSKNQTFQSTLRNGLSTEIFDLPPICIPAKKIVPNRLFICKGYELRKSLKTTEFCIECDAVTYFNEDSKGLCTVCGSHSPDGDYHDPETI